MLTNNVPIAISPNALIEQYVNGGQLDKATTKQLKRYLALQASAVERTRVTEEATSFLYAYSLNKTQETLLLAELIKMSRAPLLDVEKLEEWDKAQRETYMEMMAAITANGYAEVFETYLMSRTKG